MDFHDFFEGGPKPNKHENARCTWLDFGFQSCRPVKNDLPNNPQNSGGFWPKKPKKKTNRNKQHFRIPGAPQFWGRRQYNSSSVKVGFPRGPEKIIPARSQPIQTIENHQSGALGGEKQNPAQLELEKA